MKISVFFLHLFSISLDKKDATGKATKFACDAALALLRSLDMSSPP